MRIECCYVSVGNVVVWQQSLRTFFLSIIALQAATIFVLREGVALHRDLADFCDETSNAPTTSQLRALSNSRYVLHKLKYGPSEWGGVLSELERRHMWTSWEGFLGFDSQVSLGQNCNECTGHNFPICGYSSLGSCIEQHAKLAKNDYELLYRKFETEWWPEIMRAIEVHQRFVANPGATPLVSARTSDDNRFVHLVDLVPRLGDLVGCIESKRCNGIADDQLVEQLETQYRLLNYVKSLRICAAQTAHLKGYTDDAAVLAFGEVGNTVGFREMTAEVVLLGIPLSLTMTNGIVIMFAHIVLFVVYVRLLLIAREEIRESPSLDEGRWFLFAFSNETVRNLILWGIPLVMLLIEGFLFDRYWSLANAGD